MVLALSIFYSLFQDSYPTPKKFALVFDSASGLDQKLAASASGRALKASFRLKQQRLLSSTSSVCSYVNRQSLAFMKTLRDQFFIYRKSRNQGTKIEFTGI